MGEGARRLAGVLVALVFVACSDVTSSLSTPPPTGAPTGRFVTRALSVSPLSADGAILSAPVPPRQRPLPADETCPALADPGFTARCGIARTADGPLVWLVQTRTGARGLVAQVLRQGEGGLDVVLEAVDENGARFDDIRSTVTDITGDGSDEISMSFYRRGARQVLGVDVVSAPGVVVLHRDYVQGSARATPGRLEGWEAVSDGRSGHAQLSHETVTFRDGTWHRTATASSSTAVYGQDFADPFVLRAEGRYFGYSTNRGPSNVPVITSPDLKAWYSLPDALPQLPAWTSRGRVWAPSVLRRASGYVLYYATRELATGLQCLSRAFSSAGPEGPFVDTSTGPFICQRELSGSIDASPYVDVDGRAYLVWKSEDADGREPSRLWSQALSPDGMSLEGEPAALLAQDLDWEAPTIEGPSFVRDGGRLYLFYSAGRWQNTSYAVGYAACSSPLGPCEKVTDVPLLRSAADKSGPGGPGGTEVVVDGAGSQWMAYHAWVPFEGGYPAGRRMLHLTSLRFESGRAILGTGEVAP